MQINNHISGDFLKLLELIHDPVIIFDPVTNKIFRVNDSACLTYGIERERFLNLTINYLWSNKLREAEMFGDLFEKGYVKDFETTHMCADGSPMEFLVNASLAESDGGKVVISINQNITEQRRAAKSIKLALSEWRDTVDSVGDLIILEDGNGNLRRCNKATAEFLDLPYEKILGHPIKSLFSITPENFSDRAQYFRDRNWEGKFDGCDKWFEIDNHPIKSQFRHDTRWVHIIKDITTRKLAEEEIRKFFTVVEQASLSVYITDLSGKIQYVNTLIEDSFNENKEYFIGKNISEIKPVISEEILTGEIIPTLSKNNIWRKNARVKAVGEEFFEEITVSNVKDDQGKVFSYVFACRDVTETRRLESIAEAVNMMDNVGYIFSGIRHELGNPINSVKMALTVLEKNLEKWDREQVAVYINRCMLELSRVEYLLRALKSFSLHENPKMEKVSLADFLENFVSFAKGDFEKRGIEINLSQVAETSEARCDARALHQVMINLITNAADALQSTDEPKIIISLNRIKNNFQITVEDNGCGMSEKQIANLFKPFYTSKEGGTGLGLVIVHKMLVRMNGTIFVESKLDAGTKVNFTLEAATEDDQNERK